MNPALRRAWSVLGAATLALMLWFIWSGRVRDEAVPPVVAEPALTTTPTEMSALSVPASSGLPTPAAHGSDEIELCGGVWVKAAPDGSVDAEDLARVTRLPELRARLIDSLRADSSEFAQAASVLLGLIGTGDTPVATGDSATPCAGVECETNRRAAARVAEARDTLARMAAATSDPRVYALAFNTCGRAQPAEGACQLLSPEQWARLDPDNAAPWLFVLAQAGQRRDAAAQNEALFRLSTSARSDQYFFAVPGLVIEHLPTDEAATPAVLTLAAEAIGLAAAQSVSSYQTLLEQCKPSALRDANRRQTCGAAAELLVERSDTLLDFGIGVALGQRVGWSEDRIDRLRGEQSAYVESLGTSSALGPADGCSGIRRDLATLGRHARLGEVGALREWVAQSGRSPADFIRAEREGRARMAAAAASAQAASAASAAR